MFLDWISLAVYGLLLGSIVASDYKYFKIPNKLVFPGMAAAILFNILQGTWQSSLIGGFAVLAMFILSIKLMKAPVGMGDLKLSMLIGFMLGWPTGLWAVFAGVLGGAIVGLLLIKTGVIAATYNSKTMQFKAPARLPMAVFLGVSAGVLLLASTLTP